MIGGWHMGQRAGWSLEWWSVYRHDSCFGTFNSACEREGYFNLTPRGKAFGFFIFVWLALAQANGLAPLTTRLVIRRNIYLLIWSLDGEQLIHAFVRSLMYPML